MNQLFLKQAGVKIANFFPNEKPVGVPAHVLYLCREFAAGRIKETQFSVWEWGWHQWTPVSNDGRFKFLADIL